MADRGASSAIGPRIVLRYRSNLGDQLHVAMVAGRHSTWFTVLGSLLLVAGFGNALLFGDPVSLLLGLLGLASVTGLFSVPFTWLTVRRSPDLWLAEWETVASREGLSERSSSMSIEVRWSTVREVQETSRVFLLYGAGGATFVPKRALGADDLAALRALLVEVGVRPAAGSALRRVIVATAVITLLVFAAAALSLGLAFVR